MARNKLRRISFFTEREALRASKSGILRSSPRVRGRACADFPCVGVLAVIRAPIRADGVHATNAKSIRAKSIRQFNSLIQLANSVRDHFRRRWRAWPLYSV